MVKLVKNKASLYAFLLSLPFVALASYLWLFAYDFKGGVFEAYWLGERIYMLGFPLTGIVIFPPHLTGENVSSSYSAIYVIILDILFVFQWIIWANLLLIIRRKIKGARNKGQVGST